MSDAHLLGDLLLSCVQLMVDKDPSFTESRKQLAIRLNDAVEDFLLPRLLASLL